MTDRLDRAITGDLSGRERALALLDLMFGWTIALALLYRTSSHVLGYMALVHDPETDEPLTDDEVSYAPDPRFAVRRDIDARTELSIRLVTAWLSLSVGLLTLDLAAPHPPLAAPLWLANLAVLGLDPVAWWVSRRNSGGSAPETIAPDATNTRGD